MRRKLNLVFVTVVPSPYQRDLFGALAARNDVDLTVHYMEQESPDSPWPIKALRPFEKVMKGLWLPFRGARLHVNYPLPDCSSADFVVISTFSSLTGQLLMRSSLRHKRWIFWGERLRSQNSYWRSTVQRWGTAPLAKAAAIVGIGTQAMTDYAKRFPQTRHFTLPYYCDLTAFKELPGSSVRRSNGPFTFLFCGQMIRRKGVDLLLQAFDRLVLKGLDVSLLLVGREADLPEFLQSLSAAARARIVYEGFQPPERLPEYFSRSDLFILPSRHDGWGVVVNQAVGAGLGVIASDAVGAGYDLVQDGVNGRRFRAGDAGELEKCMEQAVNNPELLRNWGQASRAIASSLTPEAGAERWVRVLTELSQTN